MKLKSIWFLMMPVLAMALLLALWQTAVGANAAPVDKEPLDPALVATAQTVGMVPVIVGLHLPGYAPEAADEARQMAAIQQMQTAVLDTLTGYNIQNVKPFPYIPYMALWVDEAALYALHQAKEVTTVYEDRIYAPNTGSSSLIIRSDSANSLGYRGQGQTVAVLDTGVQRTPPRPDRQDRLRSLLLHHQLLEPIYHALPQRQQQPDRNRRGQSARQLCRRV
jgi:hypothetical protein